MLFILWSIHLFKIFLGAEFYAIEAKNAEFYVLKLGSIINSTWIPISGSTVKQVSFKFIFVELFRSLSQEKVNHD
jgi:hypothetical protein